MPRLCTLSILLVTIASTAAGQPLGAAGDGADIWLIAASQPPADAAADQDAAPRSSVLVLHRRMGDPAGELHRVAHLRGRVVGSASAADGGRLWLVYDDMTVQTLSPDRPQVPAMQRVMLPAARVPLPRAAKLRSLAVTDAGPFALVHVDDAATLAALDQPPSRDDDALLPPALRILEEDDAPQPATADAIAAGPDVPQDRLLRLRSSGWTSTPLPDDWPADARGWLVRMRPNDAMPRLIAMPRDAMLSVYTHSEGAWRRQDYNMPVEGDDELRPIVVDEQLVIGRLLQADDKSVRVALSVLRSGQVIDLGELAIEQPPTGSWTLAAMGQAAALVVLDQPLRQRPTSDAPFGATSAAMRLPGALYAIMDLQGHTSTMPMTLTIKAAPSLTTEPNQLIIIVAMCLAMLVLLRVWRRDPYGQRMALPDDVVAADLARRVVAAAIDLAPCVVVVMFLFSIAPNHLQRTLLEAGDEWADQWPRLTVIGLNVLHTMLTEMFTARTLGKWAMGLRVVAEEGKPPNVWQAIARNVTRAFDLIAWYVLPILVIITPYHQRLGDMLARTAVVMDAPAKTDES